MRGQEKESKGQLARISGVVRKSGQPEQRLPPERRLPGGRAAATAVRHDPHLPRHVPLRRDQPVRDVRAGTRPTPTLCTLQQQSRGVLYLALFFFCVFDSPFLFILVYSKTIRVIDL